MTDANDPIPQITRDDEAAGSGDLVGSNIARLKALFPEIVTDGKVDFDVLRELLGDAVEDGDERYGLSWKGKRRARAFALTPNLGTLRPAAEDSVDWDATKNIVIEGDNMETLKLLRRSYSGRIKLIYIDPPYNTGNDFIYPDNYKHPVKGYLAITGQADENAVPLTTDKEAVGRLHTNWHNMIYPRLMMAKDLLGDDGVIAVSIDDNEITSLRAILSEIFGDEMLVSQIVVQSNKRGQTYRDIAKTHEYIAVFSKTIESGVYEVEKDGDALPFADASGPYDLWELRNRNPKFGRHNRPNLYYPIYVSPGHVDADGLHRIALTPSAGSVEVFPLNSERGESCWRWGQDKVLAAKLATELPDVVARQTRDGRWNIYQKSRKSTKKVKSTWDDVAFINERGTVQAGELGMGGMFSHPKPVDLVREIISFTTQSGDMVMDFFAGSGTTGHAVMEKNAEDGGNRRYILVQLPEPLDPNDANQSEAAKYLHKAGKPLNIAELTKERLRRAGKKIREKHGAAKVDTGFRVYKLATSNLKPWQPDAGDLEASILDAVDNVLPDRTEEDLLVELLLKTGIDLTLPEEKRTIAGRTVRALGGGTLMVCLGDVGADDAEALGQGMADWIDELEPVQTTIYFKDTGLGADGNRAATKANLAAILRQRLSDRIAKIASI